MSREERITLPYRAAGIAWMLLSHKHDSLRFQGLFPLIKEGFSQYGTHLNQLNYLPHCMGCEELERRRFLKARHWKSGIFMAAATSLPLLYTTADFRELVRAVCAKASIATSAKLLDNLNDEVQSYEEAIHSLSQYESALGKGSFTPTLPKTEEPGRGRAAHSAHEIAAWVHEIMASRGKTDTFRTDVACLVSGQIASLNHKIGPYPSIENYLSAICERSIGNVWIDVDFQFMKEAHPKLKKGNEYIFKSYLIYDDAQDIARDLRNNSVNAAVILGMNKGILSESDVKEKNQTEIIKELEKAGIVQDLLWLGDLIFLKGSRIITEWDNATETHIDVEGLMASLGLIRVFNIRKILSVKKDFEFLRAFLSSSQLLKRPPAPDYLAELAVRM